MIRIAELQVQKEDISPKYKLSESENETFHHLLAGCSILSNGPIKRRSEFVEGVFGVMLTV